jgi:hypothetical protein
MRGAQSGSVVDTGSRLDSPPVSKTFTSRKTAKDLARKKKSELECSVYVPK